MTAQAKILTPAQQVADTILAQLAARRFLVMTGARDLVAKRIRQAVEAGVDGVVASPLEAALAREIAGPDFLVVTPGVRPAGSAKNDQARAATPAEGLGHPFLKVKKLDAYFFPGRLNRRFTPARPSSVRAPCRPNANMS